MTRQKGRGTQRAVPFTITNFHFQNYSTPSIFMLLKYITNDQLDIRKAALNLSISFRNHYKL